MFFFPLQVAVQKINEMIRSMYGYSVGQKGNSVNPHRGGKMRPSFRMNMNSINFNLRGPPPPLMSLPTPPPPMCRLLPPPSPSGPPPSVSLSVNHLMLGLFFTINNASL